MCRIVHENDELSINIARTLTVLGSIHKEQGNLTKAVSIHEQSLNLLRMRNEQCAIPGFIAIQLDNLGNAYWAQGKDEEAAKMYKEANEIRRNLEKYTE